MSERTFLRKELIAWIVVPFGVLLSIFIVGGFAFQNAMELRARRAILDDLNRLTEPYTVRLDGRTVGDAAGFVSLLREVHLVPGHHSEPTNPIDVRVTAADYGVHLVLARDSERADEYWVFRASNDSPRSIGRDAGRITDKRLTDYLINWGLRRE